MWCSIFLIIHLFSFFLDLSGSVVDTVPVTYEEIYRISNRNRGRNKEKKRQRDEDEEDVDGLATGKLI